MMVRGATPTTLNLVTRSLVGVCALVGVGIAVLGARTILDAGSAHLLDVQSRVLEAQTKMHAESLTRPVQDRSQLPRGLEPLRILQAAVTREVGNHDCQLAEFKATTQMAPYTPRYTKYLPDEPWSQLDAHFTISGRLREVMGTLRGLNDAGVPVEVDSVNITRKLIEKDGSTTVSAQVDLRALVQGAPA